MKARLLTFIQGLIKRFLILLFFTNTYVQYNLPKIYILHKLNRIGPIKIYFKKDNIYVKLY